MIKFRYDEGKKQAVRVRWMILLIPFLLLGQKPKLLLLEEYKDQNISGWVMSEKLDGIRAYWDGKHLISRSGKTIHAPQWFTRDYPPFEVDGELWTKREDFEHIASIVRDKSPGPGWSEIKHCIFEVPHAQGNLTMRLGKAKPYENEHFILIPQIKIRDRDHLKTFLKEVEQKGGEGIVVRDPSAPYIDKRTSKALKVKSFQDTECKIIGYTKGKGKYKDLVGAIQCEMQNATVFKIGSGLNDQFRNNPPPIGTIITFKYQSLTKNGKPRFPVFVRVRE